MGFIQIFRCCISNAKNCKNARGRQTKIRKNAGKIRGGKKWKPKIGLGRRGEPHLVNR